MHEQDELLDLLTTEKLNLTTLHSFCNAPLPSSSNQPESGQDVYDDEFLKFLRGSPEPDNLLNNDFAEITGFRESQTVIYDTENIIYQMENDDFNNENTAENEIDIGGMDNDDTYGGGVEENQRQSSRRPYGFCSDACSECVLS